MADPTGAQKESGTSLTGHVQRNPQKLVRFARSHIDRAAQPRPDDRLAGTQRTGAAWVVRGRRYTAPVAEQALRADTLLRTQQLLYAALQKYHMAAIVRIGRADLPRTRDYRVLRMPSARPTVDRLVASARAMVCIDAALVATWRSVTARRRLGRPRKVRRQSSK